MKINGQEIENLVTFGCSFTYGQGLDDIESQSWTALLADKIKATPINLGVRASGNENILSSLIDHFSADPNAKNNSLVAIAFTHYSRVEFIDVTGKDKRIFHTLPVSALASNNNYYKPWIEFLNMFFSSYFDEEYYYLRYLRIIVSIQTILKSWDIPYVMFESFGNREIHQDYLLHPLSNSIIKNIDESKWINFRTRDFVSMTDHRFILPCKHPGPEQHAQMMETIYNNLLNMYKPEW